MSFTTVYLTSENQASGWQENKQEQFVGNDIYILLASDTTVEDMLRKVQQSARKIEQLGIEQIQLAGNNWSEQTQWAFAMGFTAVNKLTNVQFCGEAKLIQRLDDKLAIYAWSRNLMNQTPAQLFPEQLAKLTVEFISALDPNHVSSTIIKGEDLAKQGYTGIYNVGKGSEHAPCLLVLDYNPSGDDATPVSACLVGKGITFDSGGYSIKPSASMFDMKCDMGGAAVVAGALALAIKQGLTSRVKLFLCCAENMVSDKAFRLGDILTYKNDVTVEIANTDAEGRLVLADGLIAASETKAPLIIDAATLTGAALLATGGEYNAVFSLEPSLVDKVELISKQQQEPVLQLPLALWHQGKCPSAFADTANSNIQKGGGLGGASNAAGFLSRFVDDHSSWLHFDLSAVYNGQRNGLWAAGGTGRGISVIAELLK